MRQILVFFLFATLTACTSLKYDQNNIKVLSPNWESINTSLKIGDVNYMPPSGIGQRSFSITSGVFTLFTDTSRDIDISVPDLVRSEINRVASERLLNKQSSSESCTLNTNVFYLKMNKMGATITTFRYSLLKGSTEIYKAKIDSKYSPDLLSFGNAPSESQLIASGIHKNFNDLIDQPQFKSTLLAECQ